MFVDNNEKNLHEYLDRFFADHEYYEHDDNHLSRAHRSYVKKNKGKFTIEKRHERMTGQPVYDYGNRRGAQYRAKGKHVGWGGTITYVVWTIRKVGV